MNQREKAILAEFSSRRDLYERLEAKAGYIINNIIKENNLYVMETASRTKEIESLKGKLERKSGKYNKLNDITDLTGFRIICYFSDAVDVISELLEKCFEVDKKKSVDKRASLAATQFGYLSLHLICSLSPSDDVDDELVGIPFEIQIRTVLQHVWAEIEHDLGYKSEFGVPRPIRREFSRVAGLLEIADRQFVDIKKNSLQYAKNVHDRIKNNDCQDILIDLASLREYLNHNVQVLEFINKVRTQMEIEIFYVDPDNILSQIEWMGLDSLGDFRDMFERNSQYVYEKLSELKDETNLDIISTNNVIRYALEGQLRLNGESESRVRQYYRLISKDKDKVEKLVREFMGDISINYIKTITKPI